MTDSVGACGSLFLPSNRNGDRKSVSHQDLHSSLALKVIGVVCPPDDRGRVRRSFDEAIGGGTRWESEHRSHQANGEYRWVIARAVVERDGRGRPLRMPGVVVDVTDRKRAEAERERFFSVAADMLAV